MFEKCVKLLRSNWQTTLEKTRSHDREIQYVYENPCSQPWPPSYTMPMKILARSRGRRHTLSL